MIIGLPTIMVSFCSWNLSPLYIFVPNCFVTSVKFPIFSTLPENDFVFLNNFALSVFIGILRATYRTHPTERLRVVHVAGAPPEKTAEVGREKFSLLILRGPKVLCLIGASTKFQSPDINQFRAIQFWNFGFDQLRELPLSWWILKLTDVLTGDSFIFSELEQLASLLWRKFL